MLYHYLTNKGRIFGDNTYELSYLDPSSKNTLLLNFPKHSYDADVPDAEYHKIICGRIVEQIKNIDYSYILITVGVTETTNPEFTHPLTAELLRVLESLKPKLKNYCIIFNTTTTEANYPSSPNILVLPWFLCSNYSWYEATEFPAPWKPENKNVLFLPGKLEKISRLPMLYHLLNSDLKNRLTYSCNPNYFNYYTEDQYYQTLVFLMNTYTDYSWNKDSVSQFISKISRSVDLTLKDQNLLFCVPQEIYSNVLIEILSETETSVTYNLSEKSFRPVVIGYPFVHFNRNFKTYLNKLGFRTFDEVLTPIMKEHDLPYQEQNKMFFNQVINDCKFFIDQVDTNLETIQSIINHNKNLSQTLYRRHIEEISRFVPEFISCYRLLFSRYISYEVVDKQFQSLDKLRS